MEFRSAYSVVRSMKVAFEKKEKKFDKNTEDMKEEFREASWKIAKMIDRKFFPNVLTYNPPKTLKIDFSPKPQESNYLVNMALSDLPWLIRVYFPHLMSHELSREVFNYYSWPFVFEADLWNRAVAEHKLKKRRSSNTEAICRTE